MANSRHKDKDEDEEEKWTLMFYFASDNPLAPNVVTQLKAMTNAGFHQNVNVVCHFDPQPEGTATHVFDVNMVNKLIQKVLHPTYTHNFWEKNDTYIRNLVFDKLWSEHDAYPDEKKIRKSVGEVLAGMYPGLVYDPPDPTKRKNGKRPEAEGKGGAAPRPSLEPSPKDSLEAFLEFCAESYRADRYMLFILGHGLVVGNDMLMYDANAEKKSISLTSLAEVLDKFTEWTGDKKLDLISFHSCSMSSIEVAYELRNSAKYMLASQGPAWVGSWPYREILIRLFNDKIKRENGDGKTPSVRSSIEKIFTYVLRFSYDFQLAGYSFDICLSNLDAVDQITSRLYALASSLTKCLKEKVPFVKEAILLAHWDAQSFWQESYTDLYDFCFCLKRRCKDMARASPETAACLNPIIKKCGPIIAALESHLQRTDRTEGERVGNGTIVRTEFAGPKYQYAHGLSVYFPWAQPSDDYFWQTEYRKYAFAYTGWAEFLQTYFDETQRSPVWVEVRDEFKESAVPQASVEEELLEEITRKVFNPRGLLNKLPVTGSDDRQSGSEEQLGEGDEKPGGDSGMGDEKPGGDSGMGGGKPGGDSGMGDEKPGGDSGMGGGKPGGDSGAGGDCNCPGVKNYPSTTRVRDRGEDAADKVAKPTSTQFFQFLIKEVD